MSQPGQSNEWLGKWDSMLYSFTATVLFPDSESGVPGPSMQPSGPSRLKTKRLRPCYWKRLGVVYLVELAGRSIGRSHAGFGRRSFWLEDSTAAMSGKRFAPRVRGVWTPPRGWNMRPAAKIMKESGSSSKLPWRRPYDYFATGPARAFWSLRRPLCAGSSDG